MRGEFSFNPQKILNKTLLFDTKKIDEEIIMAKIIEALPPTNDEFFIEHPVSSNAFTLNWKMEDAKKLLQKAKNIFSNLKTDPNSVSFSEEKIDTRLLKKF